jgi:hypothetical protein
LLLVLLEAACGPAATPTADSPLPAEELRPTDAAPAEPTLPLPSASQTISPEAGPTETVFVGAGGQFATDPSTVDLASGRPTLVKFFAFW